MLKQNIIFVENRAGSLRKVTELLAEGNVNIYAFACFDYPEYALFRMVADEPEKAEEILSANGYMNRINECIIVKLQDEIGGLDELLAALADSNISLNYIYTSYHRVTKMPIVILHSEEIFMTQSVLKKKGFCLLETM